MSIFKKSLVFIITLTALFATQASETFESSLINLEQNSSNLEANLTLNSAQKQDRILENSIYIHGGTSFKDKYIIKNKFVKKDKVLNLLDKSLKEAFQNDDKENFTSSLSYEIYKFNIEENHSKAWLSFDVVCFLTDMSSKEVTKQRVSRNIKVDDEFSKKTFEKAINLVADEIYKVINSTHQKSSGVTQTQNGGVVLPF